MPLTVVNDELAFRASYLGVCMQLGARTKAGRCKPAAAIRSNAPVSGNLSHMLDLVFRVLVGILIWVRLEDGHNFSSAVVADSFAAIAIGPACVLGLGCFEPSLQLGGIEINEAIKFLDNLTVCLHSDCLGSCTFMQLSFSLLKGNNVMNQASSSA